MTPVYQRRQSAREGSAIDLAFGEVRQLLREANAERAELQERYDTACEIIANHLDGGSTDRAREMVQIAYRMRRGFVEAGT